MPPKPAPRPSKVTGESRGGDPRRPLEVETHRQAVNERSPEPIEFTNREGKDLASPVPTVERKEEAPASDLNPQTVTRAQGPGDAVPPPELVRPAETLALPEIVPPAAREAPQTDSPEPVARPSPTDVPAPELVGRPPLAPFEQPELVGSPNLPPFESPEPVARPSPADTQVPELVGRPPLAPFEQPEPVSWPNLPPFEAPAAIDRPAPTPFEAPESEEIHHESRGIEPHRFDFMHGPASRDTHWG